MRTPGGAVQLSAENTASSSTRRPTAGRAARHPNWRMVPLYVSFGDETFRDYVDITPDEFYARLKDASEAPKSSQPTPADFAAVYEELAGYEHVLAVMLSSKLSGTCESARLGAESADDSASQSSIGVPRRPRYPRGRNSAPAFRTGDDGGDRRARRRSALPASSSVESSSHRAEVGRKGGRARGPASP